MTRHRPETSGQTLYRYVILPALVYTGETNTLTLYITNPPDAPIDATATRITVTFPAGDDQADLVTLADQSNIAPLSLTKGWECAKVTTQDGTSFRIYPDPGVTLDPGETVTISFSNVQVVTSVGPVWVAVLEAFGIQVQDGVVQVVKVQPGLAAAASLAPAVVGQHQTATISWSASAASYVTIVGPNENQRIPLQGPGPVYAGQTPVMPGQESQQSSYTVTAWTNDGSSSAAPAVVVTLSPPVLSFAASTLGPLDLGDSVTLEWTVLYGVQSFIDPPPQGGIGLVPASGSLPVVPGNRLVPNESAVTFALRATGFEPPPPAELTFTFNPAEVLWFTYVSPTDLTPTYKVRNGLPTLLQTGALNTLTLNGPGGPVVRYLGPGPYLEVQYFAAAPDTVPAGGAVTLSWMTLNAAQLQLQDGSTTTPLTPVAQGTTQVSPKQTTTYVLVATGADGAQVTSTLTVTVTS